jgi:glycosyltransferase involved in cell wall biosynthesis
MPDLIGGPLDPAAAPREAVAPDAAAADGVAAREAAMPDAERTGAGLTAGRTPAGPAPRFSIVIPVHNEADCIAAEVTELVGELDARQVDFELILAENGSADATPDMCHALAASDPRIQALMVPIPDYGYAMKTGMLAGRGDYIVNFDIDFHDVPFLLAAGDLLDTGVGIVVGSKLMEGAEDKRSPIRHLISYGFTIILRLLFDPHMDDTHGMKALRREVVEEYAPQTVTRQDIFDTELIIRARRGGVGVKAIPVTVEEKRKPRSSIVRRIPRTMRALLRLRIVLWKEKNAGP